MLIGYARCSTADQDVADQRAELIRLGVDPSRIYTDEGMTGTNRNRPGLSAALDSLRGGDTLIVTKLDRLGRSVSDLSAIADELKEKGVGLSFNGSSYNPSDPMGKMMFNMLATFAEFEAGLISLRTREGVARAKAAGKYKGRKPQLSDRKAKSMVKLHESGEHSIAELGEMFNLSQSGVYKYLRKAKMSDPASNPRIRGEGS